MADKLDDALQGLVDAGQYIMPGLLGYDLESWRNVGGTGTQDFVNKWTSGLSGLEGYYDQNQVNQLIGTLGGQSSSQSIEQLRTLSTQANKLYSYVENPNSITNAIKNYAKQSGQTVIMTGGGSGYRTDTGRYFGLMGNSYSDPLMSPTMQELYRQIDTVKAYQDQIAAGIYDQQDKENSFVTQINRIVQGATMQKYAADQANMRAQQGAEYKRQQDELAKQNAANQGALAKQQADQDAKYREAQAQADAAAAKQREAFNTTALIRAMTNATNQQLSATREQVAQDEERAAQSRGGEAIVGTNATTKPQKGVSTRTERWQSSRTPAAGGGSIRT